MAKSKRSAKSKRWVSGVLSKSKRGTLSRKAAAANMSTKAFACKVLRSPKNFSLATRRQAQLFVNINRKNKC